ncbi:MAG TPA: LuxR C-terminal-related transcriptional regulator [Steroidobacteraceae bacterium]|nr:LuxR C-terminal-related transcriptional regulator [Steroidobacteraceae bacterium]
MDKLRRGVLLIDYDRRIHYMNPAAIQLIEDGSDVLRRVDGRLEFGSSLAQERFAAYLRDIEARADAPVSLALRLDRPDGAASVRTLISRLDQGADTSMLSVIAYEPQGVRSIPVSVLIDSYGMTRAEAAVVAELYAGRPISEAASALGIATNTARTHLKRVFEKVQVRSQAELLQLLALGPRIT